MRFGRLILAGICLATPAFAQTAPAPSSPSRPGQAARVAGPPEPPPSESDYANAQLQTLLETVQRLTPELVETRARLNATTARLRQSETRIGELERQLADATAAKSAPGRPADWDKHQPTHAGAWPAAADAGRAPTRGEVPADGGFGGGPSGPGGEGK